MSTKHYKHEKMPGDWPGENVTVYVGPGVDNPLSKGLGETEPDRICQLLEWAYTAGVRDGAKGIERS